MYVLSELSSLVLEPENVFTLHEDIAKEVFKRKQITLHY